MRVLPPRVSATLAPASTVPVMATACSLALTTSSPATRPISGACGATVSTVIARVPSSDTLPAASVAVTRKVSAPSPIAVRSAAVSA